MLVDPLSDNPIVVAGSANFSDASTKQNDENMIVVVGNKKVLGAIKAGHTRVVVNTEDGSYVERAKE